MIRVLTPLDCVARCLFQLRGRRVILAAALYGVTTRRRNEAVKRVNRWNKGGRA